MKKYVLATIVMFLVGCATSRSSVDNEDVKIMDVVVASKKADCIGVAPMKCLVVDDALFYQGIQDFDYIEGYEYRLKIKRIKIFTKETVPADASLYEFKLIEILSKEKANY